MAMLKFGQFLRSQSLATKHLSFFATTPANPMTIIVRQCQSLPRIISYMLPESQHYLTFCSTTPTHPMTISESAQFWNGHTPKCAKESKTKNSKKLVFRIQHIAVCLIQSFTHYSIGSSIPLRFFKQWVFCREALQYLIGVLAYFIQPPFM